MARPSELTFNVLNMEPVKQAITILHELVKDERVSDAVRNEYIARFDAIEWEVAAELG